ncbi:unnamed protein product [Litomosoides sigmodontis]|uniref:F-box domain-containing protein n=1 Tax=Litomosoides sigmodontis TaxID=42156 RepID=A0A3P6U389_LITSI|nr:unnamed protein product [Litomosoides sigmodontis]
MSNDMDLTDDGTLRGESSSICSSSLQGENDCSLKIDKGGTVGEDLCTQIRWDSLHLNELPHLGYEEADSTDEFALDNMPDLVMQCIFESFNLRDRCIASQDCKLVDILQQYLHFQLFEFNVGFVSSFQT